MIDKPERRLPIIHERRLRDPSNLFEIEQLERTKRETKRFTQTFDLYPWFLLPGLVCYVLAWLSTSTWARRLA